MKFNFEVNNFGKIKHAKLKLAPFTVIAGANSSGKSFISRALYSFFNTINKDHVTIDTLEKVSKIESILRYSFHTLNTPSNNVANICQKLLSTIRDLEKIINKEFGECSFLEQSTRTILIDGYITDVEKTTHELLEETSNKKKYEQFHQLILSISKRFKDLKHNLTKQLDILSEQIESGFNDALKENFQISSLKDLKAFNTKENEQISFNFGPLGQISINKETIEFELDGKSINEFQSLYNVVFIESPIYWKLRKPLLQIKNQKNMFRLHKNEDSLSGVPQYFYDLISLVNKNIKSNDENTELKLIEQEINTTLGGSLDVTDSGEISFKDSITSKNININLTATGVTNLGLIGMLLNKNVISKGSFVFVDEPEVNLHPAWQKIMIEILYKLSKEGVNVVIASHSIDMMKYIENIMNSLGDEEVKEHFAINRLSQDGISNNFEIPPKESMSKIKEDLGNPFYEMSLEEGW